MGDRDRMPKLSGEKLSSSAIDYMKFVEKQNLERVEKLKRLRRNNIITGSLVGLGVVSIYLYSIFAVKQERFLDDFEEPQKVIEQKN